MLLFSQFLGQLIEIGLDVELRKRIGSIKDFHRSLRGSLWRRNKFERAFKLFVFMFVCWYGSRKYRGQCESLSSKKDFVVIYMGNERNYLMSVYRIIGS